MSGNRKRSVPKEERSLGENFLDDIASYIRQAVIASSVPESQFSVIEAETVQNRGVEIMNVAFVLRYVFPEFIRASVDAASFDSTSCHPGGKRRVVVTTPIPSCPL